MLDDHERRVLRELEGSIAAEDPAFARSFAALGRGPRDRRPSRPGPARPVVPVVVAVLLGAPLLLAGSVLGALAVVVTTGLLWVAWRCSSAPAD
jgi:hypothetical protein